MLNKRKNVEAYIISPTISHSNAHVKSRANSLFVRSSEPVHDRPFPRCGTQFPQKIFKKKQKKTQ